MLTPLRRGLPRVEGGDPWPPAGAAVELDQPAGAVARVDASPNADEDLTAVALRRGLPRTPGGEPFPPAAETMLRLPASAVRAERAEAPEESVPEAPVVAPAEPAPRPAAAAPTAPAGKPRRTFDWGRWLTAAVTVGFIVALAVMLARFIVGTEWGAQFLERYDGIQPLPENAPVGHPAWLGWAHFFNMFLMVMIIKSGIAWRKEGRPKAFRAPKKDPQAKLPLTLWFHFLVDLLWIALGVIFYVLLFTTGQWMRIVPTSWETLPNALSAGLQYLSLNWPTENGWVRYNALQELTYFWVVFVAAPLSIISGLRLSWRWQKLLPFIPRSFAQAVHFPNMVFFVVFIVVHVFLVLATGMRRNLNGMFAARGDADPAVYATDWTGTVIFLVAMAVTLLAWFAVRPSVLAQLGRIGGTVTGR